MTNVGVQDTKKLKLICLVMCQNAEDDQTTKVNKSYLLLLNSCSLPTYRSRGSASRNVQWVAGSVMHLLEIPSMGLEKVDHA